MPPEQKGKQIMMINAELLIQTVDEVITSHVINKILVGHHPRMLRQTGVQPTIQSENNTRIELKVGLKDTAVQSTLRDIGEDHLPHVESMKMVINYLLLGGNTVDFGLLSVIFQRLRFYHPVSANLKYYEQIISGKFVVVDKNTKNPTDSLFWVLIDELYSILDQPPDSLPNDLLNGIPLIKICDNDDNNDAEKILSLSNTAGSKFLHDLPTEDQRERLLLCLDFICDCLEDDLASWLAEEKPSRRTLLSMIIWPDPMSQGQTTQSVHKILGLMKSNFRQFWRLCAMLGEIIVSTDRQRDNISYPFVGVSSEDFARELAVKLSPLVKENSERYSYILWGMKPDWLRLEVLSRILTDLTGHHCLPEISSAVAIMEHLEQIYKIGRREERKKERNKPVPPNPELVAKLSRNKNINSWFRSSGQTRLHVACSDNQVETVRALLSFPILDLNLKDSYGRTALHLACNAGAEDCVKELLNHAPPFESTQRRVNTRAVSTCDEKTPLMVAAERGHTTICSLLLRHSGSVLLDDVVGDGLSALELCESEETRNLLQKYKKHRVETIYSKPEIVLATKDLLLVATICVQLLTSYFAVHRTWEVYHALKKNATEKCCVRRPAKRIVVCQYSRYHRDFRTHLPRVRQMVAKLLKIPQLESITDLCFLVVCMNKS